MSTGVMIDAAKCLFPNSRRGRSIGSHSVAVCGMWAVAMTLLVLASGCDYFSGKRQRAWSEEVQLNDGSVITVDRYVAFEETDALGGGAYSAADKRSTLSFRDELASLPQWDAPLVPLLLYRDTSTMEWAIVATVSTCEVWHARGGPLPPYWEYRLRGEGWRETPVSPTSLGRETNLFFYYRPTLSSPHLSLRAKHDVRKAGRFAPDYLRIVEVMEGQFCANWPRPSAGISGNK